MKMCGKYSKRFWFFNERLSRKVDNCRYSYSSNYTCSRLHVDIFTNIQDLWIYQIKYIVCRVFKRIGLQSQSFNWLGNSIFNILFWIFEATWELKQKAWLRYTSLPEQHGIHIPITIKYSTYTNCCVFKFNSLVVKLPPKVACVNTFNLKNISLGCC